MSVIRIVAFLLALMIGGGVVFTAITLWHQRPIKQVAATDPPIERETAKATGAQASAPAAREETASLIEDLNVTLTPPAGDEKDELGFDIVRVEPSGDAVVAGRAPPGATVELLRDGEPHDQAVADAAGNFVMTPPPLPAGNHALTLRADGPNGQRINSKRSVAVALPLTQRERSTAAPAEPGKPSVAASKPTEASEPAKHAVAEPARPEVAFDSVEIEPGGKLHVSGRAAPGATVRLYLNDAYLGTATAASDGRFNFTIAGGVRPGAYRVRLDEIDQKSGTVRARAEVPFSAKAAVAETASGAVPVKRADTASPPRPTSPARVAEQASVAEQKPAAGQTPPAAAVEVVAAPTQDSDSQSSVVVAPITSTVVSRGDNLWRISRSNYGRGIRYTWIYEANRDQIRDPDLIYPGQIFVIPEQPH